LSIIQLIRKNGFWMYLNRFFSQLVSWLDRLFGQKPVPLPVPNGSPFAGRISLIIIDPILQRNGGRRLSSFLGWNNPDALANELIQDLAEISHGYAQYEIVERILVNEFPLKEDGFRYKEEEYLHVWRTRKNIHQPDAIDYLKLLEDHQIIEKINQGKIDEVWTISFPWAGFYESRMAGPGAYWCNAPSLPGTHLAAKRFIVMAFNYERGVGEMLESFGHRAESILQHVFQSIPSQENLWERFTRYDKSHPGKAEVGNVHFAPNSRQDYDWGNHTPVLSHCRAWRSYPDLSAQPGLVDCREWGGGDTRAHHRWWFSLMPHSPGESAGVANNWWKYILDPNYSH
jgi:hypothetical protein